MARISVRNKDTEQQVTQQVPSVFGCCAGSKTVLPPSWPPWHSDWKMTTFKKKIVCLLCRPLTLGPFSRLRIINLAPNTIGVTGVTKASDFGHSSCLESLKSRRLEWLGSTNFCRWHCGRRSCSGGWRHTISRHHHSLPKCQHIFHREDTPTKCKSALQVPWPLAHKHCHKQLQCCSYWGQE